MFIRVNFSNGERLLNLNHILGIIPNGENCIIKYFNNYEEEAMETYESLSGRILSLSCK